MIFNWFPRIFLQTPPSGYVKSFVMGFFHSGQASEYDYAIGYVDSSLPSAQTTIQGLQYEL